MMIGTKHKEEQVNNGLHNTLTIGTTVKGDIISNGDLRMDGQIEGNITCDGKIVVGTDGYIKGDVQCGNAEIHGKVEGNLHIKEKLVLKASSFIIGNITLQTLEVQAGAKIEGKITSSK